MRCSFSVALALLAFVPVSAGCKTVHWIPEAEVQGIGHWEAGKPRELPTDSGGTVELTESTAVVVERTTEGTEAPTAREVARFSRIDVDEAGFRGERIAPVAGPLFVAQEDLERVGVRETNWAKTLGLSLGLPLGIILAGASAILVYALTCEDCGDDGGTDWDDWD
jgi:hypothetical protein